MKNIYKTISLATIIAIASSCGGGGTSSNQTTPNYYPSLSSNYINAPLLLVNAVSLNSNKSFIYEYASSLNSPLSASLVNTLPNNYTIEGLFYPSSNIVLEDLSGNLYVLGPNNLKQVFTGNIPVGISMTDSCSYLDQNNISFAPNILFCGNSNSGWLISSNGNVIINNFVGRLSNSMFYYSNSLYTINQNSSITTVIFSEPINQSFSVINVFSPYESSQSFIGIKDSSNNVFIVSKDGSSCPYVASGVCYPIPNSSNTVWAYSYNGNTYIAYSDTANSLWYGYINGSSLNILNLSITNASFALMPDSSLGYLVLTTNGYAGGSYSINGSSVIKVANYSLTNVSNISKFIPMPGGTVFSAIVNGSMGYVYLTSNTYFLNQNGAVYNSINTCFSKFGTYYDIKTQSFNGSYVCLSKGTNSVFTLVNAYGAIYGNVANYSGFSYVNGPVLYSKGKFVVYQNNVYNPNYLLASSSLNTNFVPITTPLSLTYNNALDSASTCDNVNLLCSNINGTLFNVYNFSNNTSSSYSITFSTISQSMLHIYGTPTLSFLENSQTACSLSSLYDTLVLLNTNGIAFIYAPSGVCFSSIAIF